MGVTSGGPINNLIGQGNPPTVTLGPGVSQTGSTKDVKGNNTSFTVTITTGLNVSTGGALFTVTLADGVVAKSPLRPSLTAYNSDTATMYTNMFPANQTTTSFVVQSGTLSLAANTVIMVTCQIQGDN